MGLLKKHTPPPPRDPRPKGTDWKDPGHVKMTAYLAKKENRRIERETYEKLAKKGKAWGVRGHGVVEVHGTGCPAGSRLKLS